MSETAEIPQIGSDSRMELEPTIHTPPLERLLERLRKEQRGLTKEEIPDFVRHYITDSESILDRKNGTVFGFPQVYELYRAFVSERDQTRGVLNLMGPIHPALNGVRERAYMPQVTTLLADILKSPAIKEDGNVTVAELQTLIVSKLLYSAREMHLKGEQVNPEIFEICQTALTNLLEHKGLTRGKKVFAPDAVLNSTVGKSILLEDLIPRQTPGFEKWVSEFDTSFNKRKNLPAAKQVHGFFQVILGLHGGDLAPRPDKKLGRIETFMRDTQVLKSEPELDPLATHERSAKKRGTLAYFDRENAAKEAERQRQRKYGV